MWFKMRKELKENNLISCHYMQRRVYKCKHGFNLAKMVDFLHNSHKGEQPVKQTLISDYFKKAKSECRESDSEFHSEFDYDDDDDDYDEDYDY